MQPLTSVPWSLAEDRYPIIGSSLEFLSIRTMTGHGTHDFGIIPLIEDGIQKTVS